ncbi:uncharacterized protein LOC115446873 [Manduca sexta]|uniref:Salivary secreted peptide n=1 Tax=Manduca sexta TaxID=7130 RepID=A0A921ZD57_MANSE|nr:uncharacterized protein LOC115446873 [Manduca sexta]KAG6455365.1 hypothetical protein O3G_MSEX009176 [Manduca sexta]
MYRTTLVVLLAVFLCTKGEHLQVGTSMNNELIYTENVKLSAVPLTTRTKNVFFNGNDTRVIKGIWAIDMDNSKAKATVTSGGVGFTFTNLKIKSKRGDGLNFQVQIFA